MQTEITIAAYFLFILGIGVYSAFKIKKPADYYVAGKKAGLIPVAGSLLATILGGSAILGTIELSQNSGWAALWFLFCASIGLLILVPLSKYVRRFGNFTLPELLGKFYGTQAETISSLIIPLAWIGIIAAQIIAAAKILCGLGFIDYQTAAIVSGVIFIIYTLLGGQLSILKTDTLQSLLIILGIGALVIGASRTASFVKTESLEFAALFNESFSPIDLLILLLSYSVTFVVGPDIYSRIFCARNERTASRAIFIVALLLIPFSFALTYLGIFSQSSEAGIIAFAGNLLPAWAYGLFIAALLSAVMSSADTTLLTSSMILSELLTGNLNNNTALRLTRLLIVLMGILSMLIALYVTSIIQALLLALTFFSGAFVIPTLAGLLKLRVNKTKVVASMLVGGLIALCGKVLNIYVHELIGNIIILLAYVANSLILFCCKE